MIEVIHKTNPESWAWKTHHEGQPYGAVIEQQEGKPKLTEERAREIGEKAWARSLKLMEKLKTL
jgi:hypothetical protein